MRRIKVHDGSVTRATRGVDRGNDAPWLLRDKIAEAKSVALQQVPDLYGVRAIANPLRPVSRGRRASAGRRRVERPVQARR